MKPIIPRSSRHTTLSFFPLLPVLRWKWKYYILLFLAMMILAGCFRKFYTTGTTTRVDSASIEKLKAANKYFIIHYRDTVMELSTISINNTMLVGKSRQLPQDHTTQLNPHSSRANPFLKTNRATVLSEVHLYVNKAATLENPEVKIPISDIYRMDIYQFDQGRTSTSTVLGIVEISVLILFILGIVFAGDIIYG